MVIKVESPPKSLCINIDRIPKDVIEQLIFARRKLSDDNIPWLIRTISYIRISCVGLRKYCLVDRDCPLDCVNNSSYSKLLVLLHTKDYQWWNKCSISIIGTIESSDRDINKLLRSLNNFHGFILN